ncbi:MAG: RsmB/NOP family class I SAM-dependent RNA methyltransferase [Planctomycetes bacterium]|nr:RsmB/NOP family class I SAM-dependent RNA methyltransferase [Planctomycetota bacterium]
MTDQPSTFAAVLRAAEVVQRCRDEVLGVPAAVARHEMLRAGSDAQRVLVARLASRAIGAARRLAFGFGVDDVDDAEPLSLCATAAVELRLCAADDLVQWLAKTGRRDVAVPQPSQTAARVAAIDDPRRRRAVEHSVPDWVLPRLEAALGDDVDAALAALGAPAPRTLRANLLRVKDREALLAKLRAENVAAVPARFAATAVHVTDERDLFATEAYRGGLFEQQDEASQLCVAAVAPPPGGKVLDLCCGSGGKTLALAAALQNRGQVLATDVSAGRIAALQKRIGRSRCDNVQVLHLDGSPGADHVLEQFAVNADRILVDAPCSGTGSWRRRPEARWQNDEVDLRRMQETQQQLLDAAAGWLRPGARIVYATCSLLPEENHQQVEAALLRHPTLRTMPLREVLGAVVADPVADAGGAFLSVRPDRHGCDGFFAAVLRRPR